MNRMREAGTIYFITSIRNEAMAKEINATQFKGCEMRATSLGTRRLIVREVDGNCYDELCEVLDRYPGSQIMPRAGERQ